MRPHYLAAANPSPLVQTVADPSASADESVDRACLTRRRRYGTSGSIDSASSAVDGTCIGAGCFIAQPSHVVEPSVRPACLSSAPACSLITSRLVMLRRPPSINLYRHYFYETLFTLGQSTPCILLRFVNCQINVSSSSSSNSRRAR